MSLQSRRFLTRINPDDQYIHNWRMFNSLKTLRKVPEKVPEKVPQKLTSHYKTLLLTPGHPQNILLGSLEDFKYIKVTSFTSGIVGKLHTAAGNIKLGVIDRILEYRMDDTGKLLYDRSISYLFEKQMYEKMSATFYGELLFHVEPQELEIPYTNNRVHLDNDKREYQSPFGSVFPKVGDVVATIESDYGKACGFITMTFERKN